MTSTCFDEPSSLSSFDEDLERPLAACGDLERRRLLGDGDADFPCLQSVAPEAALEAGLLPRSSLEVPELAAAALLTRALSSVALPYLYPPYMQVAPEVKERCRCPGLSSFA